MIEITRFRLAAGTDEAEFLRADRALQQEFAYQQPGLLRRTTARGEGGWWVVIDLWRSRKDLEAGAARWDADPVVARFTGLVDGSSWRRELYAPLD